MREMPTTRVPPAGAATTRPGDTAGRRTGARATRSFTRVVLVLAAASIAALALLVPTAPLLGLLLVAAILGGAVAILVRPSRQDHDARVSLDDLSAAGYVVLHDRAAPGLAGTVRRLVIGRSGVFLVEMIDVTGRVRVRGDAVIVGGRSLALGPRLQGQIRAVSAALAPQLTSAGVPVTPLICMPRAELPLFRRSVAGIPLSREAGVVHRIGGAPSVMDDATVAWVADLARSTMPPVGRVAHDEDAGDGAPRRSRRAASARSRALVADPLADPLSEAPSPA